MKDIKTESTIQGRTRGSLRHQPPGLNASKLEAHWAIQLFKREAIKPSKFNIQSE